MPYFSQEQKAKIAPEIKAVLKKYGLKGSLSVHNHSTLVLTIKSGRVDFIGNANEVRVVTRFFESRDTPLSGCLNVNPYWYKEHFTGESLNFLNEVMPILNRGNHDNSDIQSDYFDIGWYVDINVGRWNKPYILEQV